jgi:hypothetical protein
VKPFVVVIYALLTVVAIGLFLGHGLFVAVVFIIGSALAGGSNYMLGWSARNRMDPAPDSLRDGMRVTPPLEQRHIDALLAFGENCFGPMELDDDHDDALAILREHRPITQREDPR